MPSADLVSNQQTSAELHSNQQQASQDKGSTMMAHLQLLKDTQKKLEQVKTLRSMVLKMTE